MRKVFRRVGRFVDSEKQPTQNAGNIFKRAFSYRTKFNCFRGIYLGIPMERELEHGFELGFKPGLQTSTSFAYLKLEVTNSKRAVLNHNVHVYKCYMCVYQDQSTCQDWTVKNATVHLPIMKGNSKCWLFIQYVRAQNKDIRAASQMLLTRVRIHLQHKLP